METIVLVVHVLLAVGVIVLVLLQQGKGADAGATFGGGASGTVFGSKGAGTFMTRATTLFATMFFAASLVLFYIAAHRDTDSANSGSVITQDQVQSPASDSTDIPPVESGLNGSGELDVPQVESADSVGANNDVPAVEE